MLPFAYFGIESSGLNLVIDLLILFAVVVYLSLIYWTYADARRRILDPMLIGCATAASLFPLVGTIVYMILRPPEYLDDVHERELETQAAEARLRELDYSLCPHCDYRIERDFIRCPSCLRKLKERCVSCSRPLDQAWTICPYCEAEVPASASRRARRRRARALAGERAGAVGLDGARVYEEGTSEFEAALDGEPGDTDSELGERGASEPAGRAGAKGRAEESPRARPRAPESSQRQRRGDSWSER